VFLVELGGPAFVASVPPGLFLKPSKSGDVLGPLQGLKNRLSEFVRTVVKDPNVAPMHGFRHRFKTVGMEAHLDAGPRRSLFRGTLRGLRGIATGTSR
jgi:hypothetical protein